MKKYLTLFFSAFCISGLFYHFIETNNLVALNNYPLVQAELNLRTFQPIANKRKIKQVYNCADNFPRHSKLQNQYKLQAVGDHTNILYKNRSIFTHTYPNFLELPRVHKFYLINTENFERPSYEHIYFINVNSKKNMPSTKLLSFRIASIPGFKNKVRAVNGEPYDLVSGRLYQSIFGTNKYVLQCKLVTHNLDDPKAINDRINFTELIDLKTKQVKRAIVYINKDRYTFTDSYLGQHLLNHGFSTNVYYNKQGHYNQPNYHGSDEHNYSIN